MSNVFSVLVAFCFALNCLSATQTIQADSGPNFIAVELKVGDNKLNELFPNVPVGTLLFTWDNATGWKAAQMYSTGWSHPNHVIRPWEGAVMYLPQDSSVRVTLTGDVVPLPTPFNWVTLNQSAGAHLYHGLNLVSVKLASQVAGLGSDPAMIFCFRKSTMTFNAVAYDTLDTRWVFPIPQTEGAVWYESHAAPVHPEGTFPDSGEAVYFNNYAPAFGIDRKFRDAAGEPLTSGTAQLWVQNEGGADQAVGAAVSISSALPGYLEPSADLVRYFPASAVNYFVRAESGSTTSQTESQPAEGSVRLIWPLAMQVFKPSLVVLSQPQLLQAPGKVRLEVNFPITTKAVVQTSTDLEHWTDSITIDTATNPWTGEVDLEVGAKFYRVVEVP